MDKSNRIKLLEALDFGKPDAKEEGQKTMDVFVIPLKYREVLKEELGLILGNKGTGKTAIVEYLTGASGDKNRLYPNISDYDGDIEKIIICSTSVSDNLRLNPRATDLFMNLNLKTHRYKFVEEWLSFLTKKVVTTLLNKNILSRQPYLKKQYKTGKSVLNRMKEKIPSISAWVSPDGTSKYGVDVNFGDRTQANEETIDYNRVLRECDDFLKEEGFRIWVLIDDIDDLFFPDIPRRDAVIASLLELWGTIRNNFSQIKLKIFARNDLFRSLTFVGKPKLYGNFVVLEWNKKTILHMVVRRILSNEKVHAYCESVLGASLINIGAITDASRSLLEQIFYTIFEQNGTPESHKEYLISKESVYQTREALHTYRVETYLSDFKESTRKDLYPSMMRVIADTKNEFSRQELFNLFGVQSKENFDSLLILLYDVGFIKPTDHRDVNYANKFILPHIYRPGKNYDGNVFDWVCSRAWDAQGILPREMIVILNEAKKNQLKLI